MVEGAQTPLATTHALERDGEDPEAVPASATPHHSDLANLFSRRAGCRKSARPDLWGPKSLGLPDRAVAAPLFPMCARRACPECSLDFFVSIALMPVSMAPTISMTRVRW